MIPLAGHEEDHSGRGLVCEPRDGKAEEVDGREVGAGQEEGHGEADQRPQIVQRSDQERGEEGGLVN